MPVRSSGVYPRGFSGPPLIATPDVYLDDSATSSMAQFFLRKGLAALKEEDRREEWYGDWIAYQAEHHIYANVLSPKKYSTLNNEFNLLRYVRFLEVFAYFSPAHG